MGYQVSWGYFVANEPTVVKEFVDTEVDNKSVSMVAPGAGLLAIKVVQPAPTANLL